MSFMRGEVEKSAAMQYQYLKLINALFSDVNPIPVKAAMAAMGFCEDYLRAPLLPMEESAKAKLLAAMREQGINV